MKEQNQYRPWVNGVFIAIFGLVALAAAIIVLLGSVLWLTDSMEENGVLVVPLSCVIGLGALAALGMTVGRYRVEVAFVPFLISVVLVVAGSAVLGFGVMAVMLYDEPNEFMSNLWFAVGLCIAPGLILVGMGGLLYGREYAHGRDDPPKALG